MRHETRRIRARKRRHRRRLRIALVLVERRRSASSTTSRRTPMPERYPPRGRQRRRLRSRSSLGSHQQPGVVVSLLVFGQTRDELAVAVGPQPTRSPRPGRPQLPEHQGGDSNPRVTLTTTAGFQDRFESAAPLPRRNPANRTGKTPRDRAERRRSSSELAGQFAGQPSATHRRRWQRARRPPRARATRLACRAPSPAGVELDSIVD